MLSEKNELKIHLDEMEDKLLEITQKYEQSKRLLATSQKIFSNEVE